MKQFSKILLLLLLLLAPGMVWAQKMLVRGTIIDGTFNEPMAGANVIWQNKDGRTITGCQTDFNGNYSFQEVMRPGDVLVVSFTGYKKLTIPLVATQGVYDATMIEESVALKDVEITTARRQQSGMLNISERDVTTSAKRIDMSELEDLAVADATDALQGRVAGVDIVATSGAPGAGMSIRVRGTTSINGSSEPLVIVDGFPYETTIDDDFDFSTADENDYATMLNISPDDIKEITVLKDAAATAIYGSKAANGVLMITTKRGAVSKPTLAYSFKGSLSKAGKPMPMLNGDQYTTLIMEELYNAGDIFNPIQYAEFANDAYNLYNYYNYGQNTNWYDECTRRGYTQDHTISLSGGSQKAQYRVSFNYYDQKGTTVGEGYDRFSTRINLDYNISSKLKFSASMSYTYSNTDRNYVTALDSKYNILSQAYSRAPNMSVYEYDETGNLTDNYFTPSVMPNGSYWKNTKDSPYNPVAMGNEGFYKQKGNRVLPNVQLQYRPFDWFRYTLEISFDVNNVKHNAFVPQSATGRPWTENTVNVGIDKDIEAFAFNTNNKLLFTPQLGDDHNLQFLVGYRTEDTRNKNFVVSASNLPSIYLTDPSNGGIPTTSTTLFGSSSTEVRSLGLYFNLHYSWLDRYVFGFTGNYEGSSKFGAGNRWAYYPSYSFRWRLSGEPFMQDLVEKTTMTEWSFRASYGESGSSRALTNYASQATYSTYANTYLGKQGTYQSGLQLSSLQWESTKSLTLGTDLGFWDDRINATFEWYYKNSDQLISKERQLPTTTGFSKAAFINDAGMKNHGVEFDLDVVAYRTKDWMVKLSGNIARNENELKSDLEYSGTWASNALKAESYPTLQLASQPLGSYYGYIYEGVYMNTDETIARDANGNKIYSFDSNGNRVPVYMRFNYPTADYQFVAGDAKYKDVNHDGNINEQDVVYLGNGNPLLTGGFGCTVKWKQLSLITFFNFRYGNDVVNLARANAESMNSFSNQSTSVLRRWTHEYTVEEVANGTAPTDLLPRAVYGRGYNSLASSRYIEDGSFLRFKNATLKYDFPKSMLAGTFLSQASVYLLVTNIYCWTKYTGADPEVSISSATKPGFDTSNTPRSKDFTLGLSVKF
ncbi:MAG: SusC/RagA family TonB-linked outer membrane protein [Bacteroidales bacterium]|nr:SusC/RagA family TonB-linked outer membrane protein [Bacteroidales bacterium]